MSVGLVALSLLGACGEDHTQGVAPATVTAPVEAPAAPTAAPTPAAPAAARQTLTIAADRSSVGFTGAKVTGSHDGTFRQFAGTIELAPEITASSVAVTIQVGSLAIEPERLQGHLLSPDLFDAPQFPTATFASSEIVAGGTGNVGDVPVTHTVTGNLTLHGQTRSISFPAHIESSPTEVSARAEFTINRRDFGIVYPGMPDDLIRDEVVIRFDVHAPRS